MTEQPRDVTMLVPEPTPAPASEELTAEEIVEFDASSVVAASASTSVAASVAASASVEAPAAPPALPEPEPKVVTATCPNCGTVGSVDFARRDSTGFCAACDFPLFWSRDRVVGPSNAGPAEGALRRLPGTAGREALASLLCPTCDEPNPATGELCVRCGSPLRPVAVEPEPVFVFEPEPEPEPEPEAKRSWWPYIVAGGVALVALVTLLLVFYT